MKKEIYKDIIKRFKKGVIYLAVLVSITLASVISMVSMRQNMVSSIDQDTQKIFSSNSETIDNILPVNNQTIENEQDKKQEKISYVTYEEDKKETENRTTNDKKEEKGTNSQSMQPKKDTQQSSSQLIGEKENLQQPKNQEIQIKETTNKDTKKSSDPKQEDSKSVATNDNNKQNQTDAKEVFFQNSKSFIAPLGGKITNDFSDDKLIYSKTLDEWRVHQGIDIKAKEGTNVKAVLDGYVEEIKDDDEYGVTVVIRHSKSLVSVYKNLANEILVLPNQIIKQGDVVGLVGNTGKIETDLSPHLHFEMLKNNKLVDPKIYIQFEQN